MTDLSVDALLAAGAVTVPPIENDPAWQAIQAAHKPETEHVMPWDCLDGTCEHDGDCPGETMTVCDTCRGDYDGEIETVTPWPCEFAPVASESDQ